MSARNVIVGGRAAHVSQLKSGDLACGTVNGALHRSELRCAAPAAHILRCDKRVLSSVPLPR
jgi:hypothetical protein